MTMIRRCGVILFFLLYSPPSFASETYYLDKIIISKPSIIDKYIVEGSYIEDSSAKSVAEAIGLLGIDTQSRSLNYGVQTDFSFRGLNFEGLNILLDGRSINDPQTGHHNSDIPLALDDIANIELDSLRSTINIITKSPKESGGVLQASWGEHQTALGRLSTSYNKDKLGLRLSLERKESAGFRKDMDFKIFNTSLFSNFKFSSVQEAIFFVGYNEKEFGAYDFYTPNRGYPSKEWTKSLIIDTRLNLESDNFKLSPRFFWRRHFDKFMLDRNQTRSNYLNHHRNDIYTGSLSIRIPQNFFDYFSLTTELNQEGINSTNLGEHNRINYSIFTDIKKELTDNLSLDSSLRFDYLDSRDDKLSGTSQLRYLLNQYHHLSAGISYAIRQPTFTELYYEDPTTQGNSSLTLEELLTYQLGYAYEKERLKASLTFFLRQEDNLINWVKRESNQLWQARNMLAADCFGVETHLNMVLSPVVATRFYYTYVNKQLKDSDWLYKYGYNYAAHLVNCFFDLDLPFLSSLIELQYKKRPQRNGWFLVNLSIYYNINPVRKKSSNGKEFSNRVKQNTKIYCKISNLFNAEYQDIEGIPSPGRWLEAGLRLEW